MEDTPDTFAGAKNPGIKMVRDLCWLILGLFLLLAFFLPNYTTPIIDISGFDLLRGFLKDPRSISRLMEDVPTFFMIVTPFMYWFLGFGGLVVGIICLSGRAVLADRFITILAGILVFMSVTTIVVMTNRHDVPSLFAKALPKPNTVFYFTIVAELGILILGILFWRPKKSQS